MEPTIDDQSWAAQTYRDVVDTASEEGSILIVPVGSLEQHGYHLPVGTDTLLATAMAHEAAERVSDSVPVLVSPPVWTGFSPHHMPFGGTVTVERDELVSTLEGIADSALENGFDGLLLLNGHGGNSSLVDTASGSIGKDHPEAEVLSLTYFLLAAPFGDEIRDSEVGGMGHGGEFETSLMLHLYPDLVDEDQAEGTNVDEPYDTAPQDLLVGGPLSVYRPFTEYSESGVLGDPEAGTAEKGAELFSRLGDELESLLREIHDHNRDEE
jgi:creatinine amidohydrolase